jgi:hypothetical protein
MFKASSPYECGVIATRVRCYGLLWTVCAGAAVATVQLTVPADIDERLADRVRRTCPASVDSLTLGKPDLLFPRDDIALVSRNDT